MLQTCILFLSFTKHYWYRGSIGTNIFNIIHLVIHRPMENFHCRKSGAPIGPTTIRRRSMAPADAGVVAKPAFDQQPTIQKVVFVWFLTFAISIKWLKGLTDFSSKAPKSSDPILDLRRILVVPKADWFGF